MKTKATILVLILALAFNLSNAQAQDEECMNNLSIFDSYAKNKKYDEAYEPWMIVREKCPQFNRAIYVRGEKILEHKIANSSGEEQVTFIKDYLKLLSQYNEYYPSRYSRGDMLGEQAQLSYEYREQLGLNDEELYKLFDKGFTEELNDFTNPKWLYTYFSLKVNLYDAGKAEPQELFDKYDDVNDKIETEIGKSSATLNTLTQKEESGQSLTKKEKSQKKSATSYLSAYDQITAGINEKIGTRANCEVLVPLYQKDFESKKNDEKWLQRAIDKLYSKECTDDPMFLKVVQQKNSIAPNASTAYYIGILKEKEGKMSEAEEYYKQSIQLESDPLKNAKTNKRLGEKYLKRGSFGKARQYFREALRLNPSDGSPHLRIASMYAQSAPNCGSDNFEKRATFWLAADEALKAGRVDPRLTKSARQYADNYNAKAPSKSEVFSSKYEKGQKITLNCWIGGTVTVRD